MIKKKKKTLEIYCIMNNIIKEGMFFIDEQIKIEEKINDFQLIYDLENTQVFKQSEMILNFVSADFSTVELGNKTFFDNINTNIANRIKDNITLEEIQVFRKKFDKCLDFIYTYTLTHGTYASNLKEYLRYAEERHNIRYLRKEINVISDCVINETSPDENSEKVKDKGILNILGYVNDVFVLDSFQSLMYTILRGYVYNDSLPIRKCKNCNKYFVAQKRKDELYCNNIFEDTNKTCKQIGAMKLYTQKVNDNKAITLYRNITKRKNMQVTRNPDNKELKENFESWKIQAKEKYRQYIKIEITKDEFIKWLEENN